MEGRRKRKQHVPDKDEGGHGHGHVECRMLMLCAADRRKGKAVWAPTCGVHCLLVGQRQVTFLSSQAREHL